MVFNISQITGSVYIRIGNREERKRMKRLIIMLLIICTVILHGEEAPADGKIRELKEIKNLVTDADGGADLKLIPESGLKATIIKGINEARPAVCIEGLFFVEEKEMNYSMTELYNQLIQYSSLKGIEYFSRSAGKNKLLVEDAYLVDGEKERVKDPVFADVNSNREFSAYFEDTTFGDNYYNLSLLGSGDSAALSMTNESKIKYLIVTLAKPGDMTTLMQVIPQEDGFLIYGVTYTKESIPWGMEGKVTASLFNRIKAMKEWYIREIRS